MSFWEYLEHMKEKEKEELKKMNNNNICLNDKKINKITSFSEDINSAKKRNQMRHKMT